MLNSLKLVQPTTFQEAAQAIAELGDKAKLYAGGAELLLLLRHGLVDVEVLIDVKTIDRLRRMEANHGVLRIGACLTHHELASNAATRERAPAFAYAESQVANIRVRNQGTLGGNLAFNDPHSDPGTVLLVHNASVAIGNAQGERRLALDEFFIDMYATALEPGELLLEVEIPSLPARMSSAYLRLHRYQRPTLGVAVAARMTAGVLGETRLAVGCIGARAQRLTALEGKLIGAPLSDAKQIIAEQKKDLRELLEPVDDLLGSADYKLYMAGVMIGDALEQASRGAGVKP